jgi:hypothetical protein
LTNEPTVHYDISRYAPLGLMGNPFSPAMSDTELIASDLETVSEGNRLLRALLEAKSQERPKPICIVRPSFIPAYYSLSAVSAVERSLATDDNLNLLHAYVQLYMLRSGRIRATLGVVGERVAFRYFDKTLAAYVKRVLAEPDEQLIAYQVLGEEAYAAFVERFDADPAETVAWLFGGQVVERRPELTQIGDVRTSALDPDVEEDDGTVEIDSTVEDAPGTDVVLAEEADAREHSDDGQAVVDYIVEYTKTHLSPVIARALRVYRERGLTALATELKVTKAPRKTLSALVDFALTRFDKVVLIYDGFDTWATMPQEMKTAVAASLNELRWALDGKAIVVTILEKDAVPEIQEPFSSAGVMEWDFSALLEMEDGPNAYNPSHIDRWLARAAAPGAEPISAADPVVASLADAAAGNLRRFAEMAFVAIEDAAERGVGALDEQARLAGLATPPRIVNED